MIEAQISPYEMFHATYIFTVCMTVKVHDPLTNGWESTKNTQCTIVLYVYTVLPNVHGLPSCQRIKLMCTQLCMKGKKRYNSVMFVTLIN